MTLNLSKKRAARATVAGLLALGAMTLSSAALAAGAQEHPPVFLELIVNGFQASSSSPFLVKGHEIGNGVWQRQVGPILGLPFAAIPSAPGFAGATCQAEYSRDRIVAEDGSTITLDVFGTRCQPSASPIAHATTGVYSFVGGTGRFKDLTGGTGPITITAYADGTTFLRIDGMWLPPPIRGRSGSDRRHRSLVTAESGHVWTAPGWQELVCAYSGGRKQPWVGIVADSLLRRSVQQISGHDRQSNCVIFPDTECVSNMS
jgi:hypothetical protein